MTTEIKKDAFDGYLGQFKGFTDDYPAIDKVKAKIRGFT